MIKSVNMNLDQKIIKKLEILKKKLNKNTDYRISKQMIISKLISNAKIEELEKLFGKR